MIGFVARLLLVLAGFITSFFVARDELKFSIIQMIVAVILFTLIVAIVAFWPTLKSWYKRITKSI